LRLKGTCECKSTIFATSKFVILRTKVFGIVFLFLLVVPFSTLFLVLKNQQKQVRREVKWRMIAGIDKSELVLLKFSTTQTEKELVWKHAREFQYNGEFYDIVEKETHTDSVFYWCWWDHEETALNRKLENLVASHWNKDPVQKNKKETIQKLFKSMFFEQESVSDTAVIPSINRLVCCRFLDWLPDASLRSNDPPPKFA